MLPFAVQGHRTAPDGLQSAAVIAVLFGVFVWLAVWTDIPLTEVGLLEVMVIAIAGPVWMSQAMSREAFLPYSYFACRSLLDFGIAGLLVLLNMSEIEYGDQFSKAAVLVTTAFVLVLVATLSKVCRSALDYSRYPIANA